ncbi:glucose-6-phosphate isomerase, partial [Escherichia coli]|nr:glucose-6-phosphate isomerase [Escherichia coli]
MTIWDDLAATALETRDRAIVDLFDDPNRASEFSVRLGKMLFDYSKTNIDAQSLDLLVKLARECGVESRRDQMFSGTRINQTEGRAVLHTALRRSS